MLGIPRLGKHVRCEIPRVARISFPDGGLAFSISESVIEKKLGQGFRVPFTDSLIH